MTKLAILGASGHGRVVADAALTSGQWHDVVFFDDKWSALTHTGPWEVVGTLEAFRKECARYDGCCIAIGDNRTRLRVHRELEQLGAKLVSIVHASAVVSPRAELATGCVVLANAVVGPFVKLGSSCIVNNAASVDHDCKLGDAVHVSPGARLGGNVHVGKESWIGIGASIKHDVRIGSAAIVGAGAAVITDVDEGFTVVGVPARPLRKNQC
jgi:sugar O-acyltransferase (sialic acid O-acetyltransferase NeuD family)